MNKKEQYGKDRLIFVAIIISLVFWGAFMVSYAKEDVKKAFLGVSISDIADDELAQVKIPHGIRVMSVEKGQAAEKAGIQEDDIITYLNEQKIRNCQDLTDELESVKPGDKVKIKIYRQGKEKEIIVPLGERLVKKDSFTWLGTKDIYISGHGTYLGVSIKDLNVSLAEYFGVKAGEGVLVLDVEKESPAEKAEIKSGDVIVELSGKKISDAAGLTKEIGEHKKGDKMEVVVVRHQKRMKLTAELESGREMDGLTIKGIKGDMGHRYLHMLPHFNFGEFDFNFDLPKFDFKCFPRGHKEIVIKLKGMKEDLKEKVKEIKEKIKKIKIKENHPHLVSI